MIEADCLNSKDYTCIAEHIKELTSNWKNEKYEACTNCKFNESCIKESVINPYDTFEKLGKLTGIEISPLNK